MAEKILIEQSQHISELFIDCCVNVHVSAAAKFICHVVTATTLRGSCLNGLSKHTWSDIHIVAGFVDVVWHRTDCKGVLKARRRSKILIAIGNKARNTTKETTLVLRRGQVTN